jgi:hypothetical protein
MNGDMVDTETVALDAELSIENELRARLESAIADNEALRTELDIQRRIAHRWRRRAESRKELP